MWRVDAPVRSADQTFERCVHGVRDLDLRARFEAIRPAIVGTAQAFDEATRQGTIAEFPSVQDVGDVSGDELRWLYTNRLVRSTTPGRVVYDEIMLAAPNGRCPMCGHRQVSTLDHYMPRAFFPALSVAPLNLIPACGDCNKAKLDAVPANAEEVTLHPYVDNVDAVHWLAAEVRQTAPASVHFYVDPPDTWDPTVTARVGYQFLLLGLPALYASQAAEEIMNIRHLLGRLLAAGGGNEVAAYLADQAESRCAARLNSWQTAMYTAVKDSAWFCNGGFDWRRPDA